MDSLAIAITYNDRGVIDIDRTVSNIKNVRTVFAIIYRMTSSFYDVKNSIVITYLLISHQCFPSEWAKNKINQLNAPALLAGFITLMIETAK